MTPGAHIVFDTDKIAKEWGSSVIDPWLRTVIVVSSLIYHEMGSNRCRIIRIIGEDPSYRYGRSADISVLGLPGVRKATPSTRHKLPQWITDRVNLLFPFGDGEKECATYQGIHIKLEVPFYGFCRESFALSDWGQWGATGRKLTPRKIRV